MKTVAAPKDYTTLKVRVPRVVPAPFSVPVPVLVLWFIGLLPPLGAFFDGTEARHQ